MTDYEKVEKTIRYLNEHYHEQPDLLALANAAGLSGYHFHRLFKRWAGVTPKDFVRYLTAKHAKALLMRSRSVLDASLESGLSGPGRLHDLLIALEGVTPGEFKAQGEGIGISYGFHMSPFGMYLIGLTGRGICHLSFLDPGEEQASLEELRSAWPKARIRHDQKATALTSESIFSGGKIMRRTGAKIPLIVAGTPFRLKVWEAVLRIPFGRVLSYKDICRALGSPGGSRAVGTALANNPIAYLIPCHRVIRETGVIGDYRWGSTRKQAILAWEGGMTAGEDQDNAG